MNPAYKVVSERKFGFKKLFEKLIKKGTIKPDRAIEALTNNREWLMAGAEQTEDSFQMIRSFAQKISRPLRNPAWIFMPKGYVSINVRTF